MSPADFDLIALRHLDGLADAAQCERLASALTADPAYARHYARLARRHHALGQLLRGRPLAPPARRRWWRWPAAAAALAAALALWLALRPPPGPAPGPLHVAMGALVRDDGQAIAAGAALRAGEHVTTTGAATLERRDEATRFATAAGTRLAIGDLDAGTRLRLEAGSIAAEVAPQPSGHQVIIATPHASATAAGGSFTLAVDGAGAVLAVRSGVVRFADAADQGAAVAAGASARSTVDGITPLPRILRAFGAEPADWWVLRGPGSDARLASGDDPGCPAPPGLMLASTRTGADAWATLIIGRLPLRDAAAWDGVCLWLRGSGDGRVIRAELSGSAAPDHPGEHERFETRIAIAWRGWRLVRLPWPAFTRRADWQPAAAPRLGLDPHDLDSFNLNVGFATPDRPFAVAGVALYRE